ncbi:two-component sensor histidine kinase [Streptomyces longisporoflavus]|uniref:sensor histidine kinase n=1 Tax=Streptomyces longisporoflavus TaxID=28044 RepID=UPI00167E21E8|nr:sensor histidine kinase [Streptomyces longisporoflavus]GGV31838.1 two-component sensor histidine kinase [Streptomyces longisporoflavus]
MRRAPLALSRLRAIRPRPYVMDAALAAVVLFAVSLQFLFPDEGGDPLSPGGFLLGAGTAVPLIWRRRAPFACAAAIAVFTPAMALYHRPPPDVCFGGMVALYTVAALSTPLKRRLMLAGWLTGAAVTMALKEHAEPYEYPFHLISLISAYALGAFARVQRAYAVALEDRARRLERERATETARAVSQERSRIARDMHDILAHAVSLMVVQAEAGPVVVRSDPDRAVGAFDAIADAGRDAMVQLRRILGVLREPSAPDGRDPQPTLAALPELTGLVERTGLRVGLAQTGQPRPLPPYVEVAAYRIVQEALTNCVKHARATQATVRLDWLADELRIRVQDDGVGLLAPQHTGHGLVGIRERAAACGGTAEAGNGNGNGNGNDGGFCVAVRLPTASWGDEHPGGGRRRSGAGTQRLLHDP